MPDLLPITYDLRVNEGECVLIESRNRWAASGMADLCSGIVPLREGKVLFEGLDWSTLREPQNSALKGRIGRVYQKGGWMDTYSVGINIILPLLHHTRLPIDTIIRNANAFCVRFGLLGLPMDIPRHLNDIDLIRASFVKAFACRPDLLLLEYPIEGLGQSLLFPLMEAMNDAQSRGTAIICFTSQLSLWSDYQSNIANCMGLEEKGLILKR